MSNTAKLREKARVLEQREQWKDALAVLHQMAEMGDGESAEVGLWNRIGDLHAKVGEPDRAVEAYEHAADVYADAGLHNNAIALCKKALRLVPGRHPLYLKLGRVSAAKGFLADARQSFLEYAERTSRAGQMDASFEALREFADLSPEDTEIRRLLADQLRSHGRLPEAAEQLRLLRERLLLEGRSAEAAHLRTELLHLGPEVDPDLPAAAPDATDPDFAATFPEALPPLGLEPTVEETAPLAWNELVPLEGLQPTTEFDGAGEPEPPGEAAPIDFLPRMEGVDEFAPGDDEDEDSEPLPLLDLDEGWQADAERKPEDPLPALRARAGRDPLDGAARRELVDLLSEQGRTGEALAVLEGAMRDLAAHGAWDDALAAAGELLALRPNDLEVLQAQVELSFRTGRSEAQLRAYLELARGLRALGEAAKSRAVYRRVLEIDPAHPEARAAVAPPPSDRSAYVDLGALILEEEPREASTRFVMDAEPPSGDEDRDFAEMLSAFKKKVDENIDAEDSTSHYDLGLAFMDMGLLDEAIGQFQVALRGGANPLATLEVLGRCFALKGQFAVASRVLERATRIPDASDTDLIGVLYELALAEQATGRRRSALEYLERVLALDIRFRDAAEQAASLRAAKAL